MDWMIWTNRMITFAWTEAFARDLYHWIMYTIVIVQSTSWWICAIISSAYKWLLCIWTNSTFPRTIIDLSKLNCHIIWFNHYFSFLQLFKLTLRLCYHNSHQLSKSHLRTLDFHYSHLNLRFWLLFVTKRILFRHCTKVKFAK